MRKTTIAIAIAITYLSRVFACLSATAGLLVSQIRSYIRYCYSN